MTKREAFQLLSMIACYYEQFVVNQTKVDAWAKVLRPYDCEPLEKNLLLHVAQSPYPPKISELIRQGVACGRVVPDCSETEGGLKQKDKPASDEVAKAHLAKMREILGIDREEH